MANDAGDRTNGGGNLWDALFGEISRAADDVRDKVVLEPWFGPGDGGDGRPSHSPDTQSVAEELGWVKSERDNFAPGTPTPDHGAEFDR